MKKILLKNIIYVKILKNSGDTYNEDYGYRLKRPAWF